MSGSRLYDPSKLHLKRELTQIRKAARVLRDPGTTSSLKSPLSSSRSVPPSVFTSTNPNLDHRYRSYIDSNAKHDGGNSENSPRLVSRVENNSNGINGLEIGRKDKRVFLYNWRSNKSSSEKSLARVDMNGMDDGSSLSVSVDERSSDMRNGGCDSKSDTCVADNHQHRCGQNRRYSNAFRCRDTGLVSMGSPIGIRRAMGKKKSRRTSSVFLKQQHHMLKQKHNKLQQVVLDRNTLNSKRETMGIPLSSIALSQDDSVSLIDQSDDTEEYNNSEDLRRVSAESPLLSRLRHNNWSHSSAKFLRGSRREDSSYTQSTPALSTSSYNRHANRKNPSTVGSWDDTIGSLDDVGDDGDDPLDFPGRQGCGLPCYWSKRTPKIGRGCGSCHSPSLSDTLRRKGSRLLCGSQLVYQKRRRSSSRSKKDRTVSGTAHSHLPLLMDQGDVGGDSSFGTLNSDDELSTNFGELNLEGLSRLDGRRWSTSCRSQDGLELVAVDGEGEEGSPENIRSLSQRYRPMFFDELIGQNIVVQSLINSMLKGRIAPVYLFQGPRGTGKTSTAKIFAAALNCLATEGAKPCGICRECTEFISGKSKNLIEIDGSDAKAIDRVRYLLKSLLVGTNLAFPRYKIFVIDEFHLLPSKTWLTFLKFLEEPLPRVVFIFITTDLDNVPRTLLSRCQKYLFNKIKDVDIVSRLRKIAAEENLDVESDALELIALNADGSLRDAETMLDQLSLLGKRITTSLVNELVGVVPDEKLLELLELAMSSNTAETVKRARELMDSGVDPVVLMSQLASLIMDIIAGTHQVSEAKYSDSFHEGRNLTDAELDKLKHALKLLSEAEKQLRVSSESSTWFTATLLQLGSVTSSDITLSGSSRKQSSKITDEDPSSASREASGSHQNPGPQHMPRRSTSPGSLGIEGSQNSAHLEEPNWLMDRTNSNSKATHNGPVNSRHSADPHGDFMDGSMIPRCTSLDGLNDLWSRCIEKCHSKTLRQLLHAHGKLVSISEVDGVLVVYIAFKDEEVKSRAERFLISITNSIETVLKHNVEVRIILLPDGLLSLNSAGPTVSPHSNRDPGQVSRSRCSDPDGKVNVRERRQEIPMQRIESIIREQRLETAWLQAAEKSTPQSMSCLRPEKNQVHPQEGSLNSVDVPSDHWDDELNREIKASKVDDGKNAEKDQTSKRIDHHPNPISPSLLHQNSYASSLNKEYQGYESGPGGSGCNILFCWNTKHPRKAKVQQKGTCVKADNGGRFRCFRECRKSRQSKAEG